jgi:hypothetical protein
MMLSLFEAVEKVEALDPAGQDLLRAVLVESVYKKAPFHKVKRGEDFGTLISAGLVLQIDEPAGVVLSGDLEKVRRKLCTYLSRRNDVERYLDEDLNEHEIPKGSQFVATVTIGGGSSLSLEFPDDEITELLDRYGVNRCRGWKS